MKIRTVIFGVYFTASAVGFAVLMRFTLAEVRPRYVESLRGALQESATLLAATLGARPEAWTEIFAAMREVPSGLQVVVVVPEGRIVFDSRVRDQLLVTRDWDGATVAQGLAKRVASGLLDSDPRELSERGELTGTAPIRGDDGVPRGFVSVSRPLRSVNAIIWAERKRLAAGALLVASVTATAGWFIASRLTRSLERLTAYAQAVRDGRRAVPPGSRAQEIVTLARAFEEMRVALEGKAYVERYVQALTHELKSPLSAIRGAAELLVEDPPVETRQRFLGHIRGEAGRIQRVVDQMLQLATLETRSGRKATEAVDLVALVRAQVDALRAAAEARGVGLEMENRLSAIDANGVAGDPELLAQAVANLLQNALEFTPAGGRVEVAVQLMAPAAGGREVSIGVRDTGTGVPDFALERVFERFYSLPRPGTGAKSTGLGLSLVREIMALHGGTVTLVNRAEGGACAELRLPLVRAGAVDSSRPAACPVV